MALLLSPRAGIPTGERRCLVAPVRRTRLLRLVLGAALLASFAWTFAQARDASERVPSLLPPSDGAMVVLDLSASVGAFDRLGGTLRRLARGDEKTGLVVFSGGAYELLPPSSPTRELEPLVRFFTPLREDSDAYPRNPWDAAEFRGGTNIASGLEAAHYALVRDGVREGSILLMSDLDTAGDTRALSDALVALRRSGIEIRVVPLGARPENRAFFERILGRTTFLAETEAEAPVATLTERRLGGILPWGFLLPSALVVVLLAGNECSLARLEVRR